MFNILDQLAKSFIYIFVTKRLTIMMSINYQESNIVKILISKPQTNNFLIERQVLNHNSISKHDLLLLTQKIGLA